MRYEQLDEVVLNKDLPERDEDLVAMRPPDDND